MSLTESRAEVLGKYLTDDSERAAKLFEMSAEEAVKTINADGYDFTVDELKEFAKQLQTVAAGAGEGEIGTDSLKDVTGGSALVFGAALTVIKRLAPLIPKLPIYGPIRTFDSWL